VEGNTSVVSVKVPKRVREKMRSMDIEWSKVLRKAIETKIKEYERKKATQGFLEFRANNPVPKNKTRYTSEVLARENREER
jgi:ribosome-associated translation inhibitor RaiA